MEPTSYLHELLGAQRIMAKMFFDTLGSINSQAAATADFLTGCNPFLPDEGKRAVTACVRQCQKGAEEWKKVVEKWLSVDWTAKDALLREAEFLEALTNFGLMQAKEVNRGARELATVAVRKAPMETRALVETDVTDYLLELFQGYAERSFSLLKRNLGQYPSPFATFLQQGGSPGGNA